MSYCFYSFLKEVFNDLNVRLQKKKKLDIRINFKINNTYIQKSSKSNTKKVHS